MIPRFGWFAILLAGIVSAIAAFQFKQRQIAEIQQQLESTRAQWHAAQAAAQAAVQAKDGQIHTLLAQQRMQAKDVQDQLQRLQTIHRNATVRMRQLGEMTHENTDSKTWGDTELPVGVAKLLDTTAVKTDPPGSAVDATNLLTGSALLDAKPKPENEPAIGTKSVGNASGAGGVRGAD